MERGARPIEDGRGLLRNELEGRQALVELMDNERNLRALVESTDDVLFTLDREQRHMDIHGRWLERYNDSKERYIGKTPRDIFGDAARIHEENNRRCLEGEVISYEWSAPTNQGMRHYMTTLSPVFSKEGGVSAIVGTAKDITERVQMEESLRESEAFLRAILSKVPDYIVLYDDDGVVRFVNHDIVQRLGYPEGAVGKKFLDYIHEDDRQLATEKMEERRRGDVPPYELRFIMSDGTIALMRLQGNRVEFGGESMTMIALTDVTDMRAAEMRLIRSEESFRSLFENSLFSVIVQDLESLEVIYANPNSIKRNGFTDLNEMVEEGLYWGEPPYSKKDAMEKVRMTLEGGPQYFQWLSASKDGSLYWEQMSLMVLPFQGVDRLLAVSVDIDDMKRMELSLRLTNEKLQLLSSVIRHDVMNKLTSLRGYTELADDVCECAASRYLEKIEESAVAIQRDIQFMKEYEKLGTSDPQWIPVRLSVSSATVTGIIVENRVHGLEVFADQMFDRVLDNLLDNSIRHGGDVTRIVFRNHQEGVEQIFVWEDDGVGIPEGQKESVFGRGVGKNTGFGLFLSRQILALTGMKITEEGVDGARFIIRVPAGMWRIRD